MFEIGNTLVSLDLAERFFCCNIDACLGACCIEGDAGAPITQNEYAKLKEALPVVWDDLLPRAQQQIKESGVACFEATAPAMSAQRSAIKRKSATPCGSFFCMTR